MLVDTIHRRCPTECTGRRNDPGNDLVTVRFLLHERKHTTIRQHKIIRRSSDPITCRSVHNPDTYHPASMTEHARFVVKSSDLRTARWTTTLRPGKLLRLWPLLRHLMSPPFPLRRRLRCPSVCLPSAGSLLSGPVSRAGFP